jgi:hypothetical protein
MTFPGELLEQCFRGRGPASSQARLLTTDNIIPCLVRGIIHLVATCGEVYADRSF